MTYLTPGGFRLANDPCLQRRCSLLHVRGKSNVFFKAAWGGCLLIDQFLILGLDENATDVAIEEAFRYLNRHLNPSNFQFGSFAEKQAQLCMSRIVPAYQVLRDAAERSKARQELQPEGKDSFAPGDFKPFLGHICVAAGIISLADLNEAIDKQTDIDLPLGQILQEKQLLSQTELDGLLMGQRLYGAPMKPLDAVTRRLLTIGVVSRDMVKIVLIDQRTSMKSLPELLAQRGWLDGQVGRILQQQLEEASAGSQSGSPT